MKMLTAVFALGMMAAVPAAAQTSATYVAKAGAGDLYEKTSSKLVLATTHNPQIRRFASMMIGDHTKSTADVKAAAMRSGLRPRPPALNAEQSRMVAQLRRSRGAQRDHLYVQQQAVAHQQALALHSGYAQHGDSRPLRNVASTIVPVVQHHIDTLPRG